MKGSGTGHRHKALFATLGAIVLLVIGAAVGFVVLLSGALSTSATTQHFQVTHRLLEAGLHFSVNSAASEVAVPALGKPHQVESGAACFREHCTQCHGAPGEPRNDGAKGMLPIPNSLAESARMWSPAALYTITRDGVRMTGMPAWKYRLSEESLWSTVSFLVRLPELTVEEYARLAATPAECERNTDPPVFADAQPDELLRQYACHSCHLIDGVTGPETYVGPPLTDWPERKYVAGELPNTPDNLVAFLMSPQQVSPGSLMPDLRVPESHARRIAAFLLETP